MSKRKVGAVLTALLADLRQAVRQGKAAAGDAQVLRICVAELRAMKAVARATGDLIGVLDAVDERYGYPPSQLPSRRSARRALARLDRAALPRGKE